jgi:hypothetical protein
LYSQPSQLTQHARPEIVLGGLGPHGRIGHASAPAQPDAMRIMSASHEPGAVSTTADFESAALSGQMHSTLALAAECEAKDTAWPPAMKPPRERVQRELPLLAADLPYTVMTVPLLGSSIKPKKRRLCRRVIASGSYVNYVYLCDRAACNDHRPK